MAKGKEKGKEKDAKGAAGGDEGPDVEAEFEVLLTSKNLELAEAKAKAERLTAGLDTLRAEHTTLNNTLKGVKKDSEDILKHLERDMTEKNTAVKTLGQKVNALSTELEATNLRIAELEKEREEAAADMEMATRSIDEKVELEAMLAELKATVASQQKEIVDRELHISSLDQQLKVTNRTLDDLQLELSRSTSAVQVAEHTWTLKRAKQRLKTANPEDESNVPQIATRNTLTMVGRMGVMFGGTSKDDTLNGNEVYMLNTETNQWEKSAGIGELPAPRASHCAAVTSKKRLMFFGGRKASMGEEGVSSLSNDGYFLNPDNAKWVKLEVVGEVMPEPVEKAQMCPFGDSTLLLGGDTTPAHQMGVAKQMSIPIHGWVLTMEGVHSNKGRWRKIEFGGFVPRRCNHSITESADGRYLFLFGGSDSAGECCNDLYVLNVDRKEWSIPEMMMGTKPAAREGHVACMIGRFLVVSGGYNDHGRLFDAHVLDTDTMVWEALDTSLNQGGSGEMDRSKCTMFGMDGRRIFMIAANSHGALDELIMLDMQIPEEVFLSESVLVRKEVIQVEAVQDENDMRQISLTWRPPSNTKARVASYKVVMSIAGVALVKEIHRGTGDAFHIRGCRPGKSYQFRIKGEYSDGSYIWSDICEIYMRQPGTEVVIPKQVIALKGRSAVQPVRLRGAGGLPPAHAPGTIGFAARMTKGVAEHQIP